MKGRHVQAGFSLLEFMIALAVLGVFVAIGGTIMSSQLAGTRSKAFARSLADLMMLARTEAIRTGDNHVVFFFQDTADGALSGGSGQQVVASVIRDADADGLVDAGEPIAGVQFDAAGGMAWGSSIAAALSTPLKAPNDNPDADFPETDADFLCCTFTTPGDDPARWVVFTPDGMPRSFQTGPFTMGGVASGNGAIYVTGGNRDYAVVLAPLGGVRVHHFVRDTENWSQ
ncbi:MAG: prepilin-type N-terminal cleavage/methylation domain-containing protein [Myxococcota bacterium]|nr:prepilin-type N-terminal cleavage/methylation domain-containing protein [Myxococcota bacterium]